MRGESVDNPRESIRLFGLCEAMRWNHLPVDGGLYAQHPRLLEEFRLIFSEKAAYEAEQARERERKAKSGRGARRPSRSGSRLR